MVSPNGSALIAYAGSCTVRVGGGVWKVQLTAPCTEGATFIDFTERMNAGVACGGDKSFCAPPEEDRSWVGFVPTAAIGTGVVLCLTGVICDHHHDGSNGGDPGTGGNDNPGGDNPASNQ